MTGDDDAAAVLVKLDCCPTWRRSFLMVVAMESWMLDLDGAKHAIRWPSNYQS
jgi:hypothetical protein